MIGIPFPENWIGLNRIKWNTFWFSLDILLVVLSIIYVFHTLMIMIRHVYSKEDLKKIHESNRGIGCQNK
jgi:hypothetical protein